MWVASFQTRLGFEDNVSCILVARRLSVLERGNVKRKKTHGGIAPSAPSDAACCDERLRVNRGEQIKIEMLRGGCSPKILGALPHQPLHHGVHFLRSSIPKKYELHIGLQIYH